mgnify:CR=1 FL=1
MRKLNNQFLEDLKNGSLSRLTKLVKHDETLCLEIRRNYINIYYRGGSLLRIEANQSGYKAVFDKKYLNHGVDITEKPINLSRLISVDEYVDAIPLLKREMDFWFSINRKQERETQQIILRENNFSIVANDTDYFICDIEYAKNEHVQSDGKVEKSEIGRASCRERV